MTIFYRFAVMSVMMAAVPAFASNNRVSVGRDILVADGETGGDIVCIVCSVKVRGNVDGDVVAVLGGVTVEGSQWITGDMVTLGGNVSLDGSSSVHGDAVVVAGELAMANDATVQGHREVLPGRVWLLLPLAPLLIVIGIVWLIAWLIRRSRYRLPMYPQGRGV